MEGTTTPVGQEWLVDCSGCSPDALRDVKGLQALFDQLIRALELSVIGAPQWHVFPGAAGITGLALLSESHLAIHTFPERGFAALSCYSCRDQVGPDFETLLQDALDARTVTVRTVKRSDRQ